MDKKTIIREAIMKAGSGKFSGRYASIPSPGKTWDELKPRQVQNIKSRLGDSFDEATAVLFFDNTLTDSGKNGILFTTEGVVGMSFMESGVKGIPPMIRYRGLTEIRQGRPKERVTTRMKENCSVSADQIVARYRDGGQRVIFTSIYTQFIADAVRRICEALFAGDAQGAKKEESPDSAAFPVPDSQPEAGMADEELSNIIELQDENGDPVYFEFLDYIRCESGNYVVLFPVDDNKEPTGEEIIILEVVPDPDDDEQEQYLPVEDENTLMTVYELFREKFKDLLEFEEPEAKAGTGDTRGSELPYPNDGGKGFIFISYSHKDTAQVMGIIRQLQADGFRVWYDEGIDPGTEWDDNIADHVAHCACFLAFMSSSYLTSENCKDELNYARDLNLPRLLIYLEDVALSGGLAMRHNRLQALHYYKYSEMKGMFYKRLYESSVFNGADIRTIDE